MTLIIEEATDIAKLKSDYFRIEMKKSEVNEAGAATAKIRLF